MKFLPRTFRESQTDWFAKRGISWHLPVSIRRGNDHKLQMMTFVNVFRSCSQDSCTVLSVMSDVVRQLREHLLLARQRRLLSLCYDSCWSKINRTTARRFSQADGFL